MPILKYPAVFLTSGLLCWVGLLILGRWAPRLKLLDVPRTRHPHARPVPLVGGLAIFGAFFGACLLIFWGPWGDFRGRLDGIWCGKFLIIAGVFTLLGVLDDRLEWKPRWKLAGQVLGAVVAYGLDVRFGRVLGLPVPVGLDLVATIVWFVAMVNAFNLIDGMDGVATGMAITGGLGLLILFGLQRQPGSVLVLLAMLGACSVFLRYNFHPARFFLGDAGSHLLGAFFSTVALSSNTKGMTLASLGFPLLVVGVPLMDSVLAIWRRVMRKILLRFGAGEESPGAGSVMGGDLDHLHHRLAARGYSHRKVAYLLYALNAFLVGVGLVIILWNSLAVGLAFVSFIILVYVVVNHLATVELGLSGEAVVAGLHRPEVRAMSPVVYPLFDCAALLLGALLALGLVRPVLPMEEPFRLLWLHSTPVLVSVPMAVLFVSGIYRRLWSRARVSEYALLMMATTAGAGVAVGLLAMLRNWSVHTALLLVILLVFFDAGLIAGARMLPRLAMDLSGWRRRLSGADALSRRVVIYGAGYRSTLLLRELTFKHPDEQESFHLLGFMDDHPATWGRVIHGYPVLGGVEELCARMERRDVDEVIVTCDLRTEVRRRIEAASVRHGIRLDRWTCRREPLGKEDGGTPARAASRKVFSEPSGSAGMPRPALSGKGRVG